MFARWRILPRLLGRLRTFEPLQWSPTAAPEKYRSYAESSAAWTLRISDLRVFMVHRRASKDGSDFGYVLGVQDTQGSWTWFDGWRGRRLGIRIEKAHARARKRTEQKQEEERARTKAKIEAESLRRLQDFLC